MLRTLPPLADWLVTLRKITIALAVLQLAIMLLLFLSDIGADERRVAELTFNFGASFATVLAYLGFIFGVLPSDKAAVVLYLRSFARDESNDELRRTLELACEGLRLCGIRDPRRRVPTVLRPVLAVAFIFLYASNRRMSLEAGSAWRPRLLATLVNARAVIIDCRYPTEFIRQEIELCVLQMPMRRVLLLVRPGQQTLDGAGTRLPAGVRIAEIAEECPALNALAAIVREVVEVGPDSRLMEPNPAAVERALQQSDMDRTQLQAELNHERLQSALGWLIVTTLALLPNLGWAHIPKLIGSVLVLLSIAVLGVGVWFAIAWAMENRERRRLWRSLALTTNPPSSRPAVWLIPAGAFTLVGALVVNTLVVVGAYNARADVTIALSSGSIAKTVYAEFLADHDRAPSPEEFGHALDFASDPRIRIDLDAEGNIRITMVGVGTRRLNGRYLLLRPKRVGENIRFQCEPGPGLVADDIPRECQPTHAGLGGPDLQ